MLTKKIKTQSGFSLIEIMVAMTIGIFLIGGISGFLLINLKANKDNISQAKLNQELRSIIDLAARDLRRAGYFSGVNDTANFSTLINPSITCIIYRYDRDDDNALDTNETFGFNYIAARKTIYMRQSIATDIDCTGSYGTANTDPWLALNSTDNVEITNFKICDATSNPPSSCTPLITGPTSSLIIYIEGQIKSQPKSKINLIEKIQLRNTPTL